MKNSISRLFLLGVDVLAVFISICIAYALRVYLEDMIKFPVANALSAYTTNIMIYVIIIVSFFSEKIYQHRYDFWEEMRLILRGLIISLIIVLSILALTKSIEDFSRFVIVVSFVIMGLLIPIMKNLMKKFLFKIGLWRREAEVCGDDTYIKEEIFGNQYLGYVHADHAEAQTIFIDTSNITAKELQKRLDENLREKKEVLFVPLLQSYNFTNVNIIELTNARKNLIVLENSLMKRSNIWIKKISDILLTILVFPLLIILFVAIIALMKREEPKGKIFFKQKRMGHNGEEFLCYKFRSMYENGDEVLQPYLKQHPEEIAYYNQYHKYKNDPRITKIGKIMRKTSLDELPQVINVLRDEMSFIGPRPYMLNEKEKIGDKLDMVLAVKPGITGLWQVSGRNDVDFHSRVEMDVWYTRNWNLWLDLVILVKTIKVVLFRGGAS
ncbi:MAG: glycosyl transferase [Sulfurimonas sp.]|nr:glycosyl transferase [Sulfurimonas sp.]